MSIEQSQAVTDSDRDLIVGHCGTCAGPIATDGDGGLCRSCWVRANAAPNLFVAVRGDPDNAKTPISVGKLAEVIGVPRADLAAWIAFHATPLSVALDGPK